MPPDFETKRKRLLSISLWNGGSVVVIALLGSLISLPFQAWTGVLLGLALAASGVMELYGRKCLEKGKSTACFWMPFSQIWLILLLSAYCLWKILTPQLDWMAPLLQTALAQSGAEIDDHELTNMIYQANLLTYLSVILVTLLYQGGLAWVYRSACRKILKAPPLPGKRPASG